MPSSDLYHASRSRMIASFHGECSTQGHPDHSNGPAHPGHSRCVKRRKRKEAETRAAAIAASPEEFLRQKAQEREQVIRYNSAKQVRRSKRRR